VAKAVGDGLRVFAVLEKERWSAYVFIRDGNVGAGDHNAVRAVFIYCQPLRAGTYVRVGEFYMVVGYIYRVAFGAAKVRGPAGANAVKRLIFPMAVIPDYRRSGVYAQVVKGVGAPDALHYAVGAAG